MVASTDEISGAKVVGAADVVPRWIRMKLVAVTVGLAGLEAADGRGGDVPWCTKRWGAVNESTQARKHWSSKEQNQTCEKKRPYLWRRRVQCQQYAS